MEPKIARQKAEAGLTPYRAEDLDAESAAEEPSSEDAYIARNRGALNKALAEGERDIARGDVRTLAQVRAELVRRRKGRARRKP